MLGSHLVLVTLDMRFRVTSNTIFSVAYYFWNYTIDAISIHCRTCPLPTNVILVVWTL